MRSIILFVCLLAITGCSTVNIDCFRNENKDTPYCVDRRFNQIEHGHGGRNQ